MSNYLDYIKFFLLILSFCLFIVFLIWFFELETNINLPISIGFSVIVSFLWTMVAIVDGILDDD